MKITRRQLRRLIEANEVNRSNTLQADLQKLLDSGIISVNEFQRINNKLNQFADRAERKAQLKDVMTAIIDLVTSDARGSNHFWRVREIMTYIEADRNMIRKALEVLTKEGFLTLVGLKNIDGKLVVVDASEVNPLQHRYMVTSDL